MNESRQLCTFLLEDIFYGIDVTRVQEVIRSLEMTRVALAPAHIRGLINLRGQIVTAIDMRNRLGLPDRDGDALPMNVVVRMADGGVSLLVDEIGDVVTVSEDEVEAAPDTVPATARLVLLGVHKLERRLLLEIDPDRLIDVDAAESR